MSEGGARREGARRRRTTCAQEVVACPGRDTGKELCGGTVDPVTSQSRGRRKQASTERPDPAPASAAKQRRERTSKLSAPKLVTILAYPFSPLSRTCSYMRCSSSHSAFSARVLTVAAVEVKAAAVRLLEIGAWLYGVDEDEAEGTRPVLEEEEDEGAEEVDAVGGPGGLLCRGQQGRTAISTGVNKRRAEKPPPLPRAPPCPACPSRAS